MVPVEEPSGINPKGQQLLTFIQHAIASGRTVYLTNAMKSIPVSAKTMASWAKGGHTLFRLAPNGDLLMASGNSWVRLTSGDLVMMKVTAS